LARLRERGQALGLPTCVVIFEPQPREYFAPDTAPARLARLRDKIELLATEGIDRVLCLAFNQRLSKLSADAFVKAILVDGLGVRHLEVGDDFRFG
ncbi:bifunctional riboflavin kinase/FAD synthetase, partial [Paraburkholderia sp. SIMBA_055]